MYRRGRSNCIIIPRASYYFAVELATLTALKMMKVNSNPTLKCHNELNTLTVETTLELLWNLGHSEIFGPKLAREISDTQIEEHFRLWGGLTLTVAEIG